MGEPADARITRVVEAIRTYLTRHPDAADCEHGIASWWMLAVGVHASVEDVAAALERLYRARAIDRHTLPDGRVIYRAARSGISGTDAQRDP